MTEKTLDEIKEYALKTAARYKKELINAPHYMSSQNGVSMSSNGEEKGRYQVAVDLCVFLGLQEQI